MYQQWLTKNAADPGPRKSEVEVKDQVSRLQDIIVDLLIKNEQLRSRVSDAGAVTSCGWEKKIDREESNG